MGLSPTAKDPEKWPAASVRLTSTKPSGEVGEGSEPHNSMMQMVFRNSAVYLDLPKLRAFHAAGTRSIVNMISISDLL